MPELLGKASEGDFGTAIASGQTGSGIDAEGTGEAGWRRQKDNSRVGEEEDSIGKAREG